MNIQLKKDNNGGNLCKLSLMSLLQHSHSLFLASLTLSESLIEFISHFCTLPFMLTFSVYLLSPFSHTSLHLSPLSHNLTLFSQGIVIYILEPGVFGCSTHTKPQRNNSWFISCFFTGWCCLCVHFGHWYRAPRIALQASARVWNIDEGV